MMVGGKIVSPMDETLDQLKAVVDLSLTASDQLLSAIPANVRSSLMVELQYFQALKDSDFSAPMTPEVDAAIDKVNAYGESARGFSFDS